jgi:hypothetical protein
MFLLQPRLEQPNQLGGLISAEPRMSYLLTGLSDQPQHTALSDAVPSTKLSRGSSRNVLGDQAFDRARVKPLADPPLSTTTTASGWSARRRIHDVRQQGGVQFESPQADSRRPGQMHIRILDLSR